MDELCDRFGEPPRSVEGLLDVALIRSRAAALGVREIDQRVGSLLFYSNRIDREQLVALTCALPGRVLMNAGATSYLTVKLQKGQSPLDGIREVLAVLEQTAPELVSEISENGIPLTGGCSQLWGMDALIMERTGIACTVADDPDSCTAYGCGKSLAWINHMQEGPINIARKRMMRG